MRWKLSMWGVLCLGMAYGIFNEGICAKTILMSKNVPISAFDGYNFLTINLAWSILILPWHAFHAVMYPLVIVSFFFHKNYKKQWLTIRSLIIICLVFTLMGVLMFFTTQRFMALPLYLPIFAGVIIGMILLSKLFRKNRSLKLSSQNVSFYPAIVGFIFYLTYVPGLVILAQNKFSVVILLIYAVLIIALFYWFMKTKKWLTIPHLTIFGIGDYCALSFTALLIGFNKESYEIMITAILFIIIFIITILYINLRRNKPLTKRGVGSGLFF